MGTTNIKVRYMFLIQEEFANQLKQIFRSLKEKSVTKDKLKNIQQTTLAIVYLTEFQMWAMYTNQNKEALIVKYY